MAKNYPRNHTLAVFAVCLILVLGTVVLVYGWPTTKSSTKYQNSSIQPQIITNGSDIDAESDWQKQFFDSKNSDYKAVSNDIKPVNAKEEPLNPTELLGRNFFTKYTELRKAGLTNDSQKVDSMTKQLITESVAGVKTPQGYTSANIKIIPVGTDSNPTKIYAEELMKILGAWMPKKNEAEIAMIAFENDDMTRLSEIDPIISGYKTAVSKLLALPVIQPLAQYHLDLINGISLQAFNAQSLRNSDKDPLTGLAAISMEVKSLEAISGAIAKMQNYFTVNQVIFNLPVSGSILQSQ